MKCVENLNVEPLSFFFFFLNLFFLYVPTGFSEVLD